MTRPVLPYGAKRRPSGAGFQRHYLNVAPPLKEHSGTNTVKRMHPGVDIENLLLDGHSVRLCDIHLG
jgi:hypothetical protein